MSSVLSALYLDDLKLIDGLANDVSFEVDALLV